MLASGIVVQQVAFNPYMSLLGPAPTAASRMSLAHAFNSLGTTVAPAFGGLLILTSVPWTQETLATLPADTLSTYRLAEAQAVQGPYLGIACVLVMIALLVRCWPMPNFTREARAAGGGARNVSASAAAAFALGGVRHLFICGRRSGNW